MATSHLTARVRREAGNTYEGDELEAGAALADDLNPWIGSTTAITMTCQRMVKIAREHADWMIIECNRPTTAMEDERLQEVQAQLDSLARDLPAPDDGPWRLELEGDPRGATVRLLAPEHRQGQAEFVVVDR